jgi:hypothetical protein
MTPTLTTMFVVITPPDREITTSSLLAIGHITHVALKPILPFDFTTLEAMAARDAAPPMWNNRIVNWVPGSPMD